MKNKKDKTWRMMICPDIIWIILKLQLVFEKSICKNRGFSHQLGQFLMKFPIWGDWRRPVSNVTGFYRHRYCFCLIFRPISPDVIQIIPKFLLFFEKNTCQNRVFCHRLGNFRWYGLYEATGDAAFPMLPASRGIAAASAYSLEQYLQMKFELFRNSYSFSRKILVKIAFSAIDLYIFRWYSW